MADPSDYTDRYNTALSPLEEMQYQAWVTAQSKNLNRDLSKDTEDYDLRGLFKEIRGADLEPGHGSDRYKKPNHPTFSNESVYHGKDGNMGGQWGGKENDYTFTPSETNLKMRTPDQLRAYFQRVEPGVRLVFPKGTGRSAGAILSPENP